MSRVRSIWLVARREILERGRSRGYLLSLVFTLFLIGAGFILPTLLLGGRQTFKVGIVGDAPAQLETRIQQAAAASGADVDITFSHVPDRATALAGLQAKTIDAALVVPPDLSSPGEVVVQESLNDTARAVVTTAIVSLRAGASLAPPTITAVKPPSPTDTTALIMASAGIILMFIGIVSYGQWVLMGVVEEKQSRVVEVVLATVRPRDLLMGKVLGIGLLALAQIVILGVAGVAVAQLTGRVTLPTTTVSAIAMLVLWFVLGFAIYATALGFLGALASRVEDASNASTPVTMVATLVYIVSLVGVTRDPEGILGRVLTFIPLSAPMVVPLRAALGKIEPWEVVVAVAVSLAFIWLLFSFGARVYSGAVLQVGSRMKLRDAWRAAGE